MSHCPYIPLVYIVSMIYVDPASLPVLVSTQLTTIIRRNLSCSFDMSAKKKESKNDTCGSRTILLGYCYGTAWYASLLTEDQDLQYARTPKKERNNLFSGIKILSSRGTEEKETPSLSALILIPIKPTSKRETRICKSPRYLYSRTISQLRAIFSLVGLCA